MYAKNMTKEEYRTLDPKQYGDCPKETKACHATNLNLDEVESNIEQCTKKLEELSDESAKEEG